MDGLLIKLAELPHDLPQIYNIRYHVFQVEQGVDPALEFDGEDETATHLLAYLSGQAVGTTRIRLLTPSPSHFPSSVSAAQRTAKIERVAVLAEARGLGIGKQLMAAALAFLTNAQIETVQIHAQTAVVAFYRGLGFEAEGEVFEEAGISHIKMSKQLVKSA